VRENLWWALYYLQDQETEKVLWIDALCIDQNNKEERNHQVRLMGQIYAGAWRAIAWLGREDQEDFAQAVDLANLLNGDSEKTRYHIETRPQCPWGPPIWINNTKKAKLSMDPVTLPVETNRHLGWSFLQRINGRTYWSRLWIIQELILASELVLRWQHSAGLGSFELNIWASSRVHRESQRRLSTSFPPSETTAVTRTEPWRARPRPSQPLLGAIPYPPAEVWQVWG
jgi:hypothetical protein